MIVNVFYHACSLVRAPLGGTPDTELVLNSGTECRPVCLQSMLLRFFVNAAE